MIQVIPLNDAVAHEQEGTLCSCGPEVDWSYAQAIVIHRALDGRVDAHHAQHEDKKWEVFEEVQGEN